MLLALSYRRFEHTEIDDYFCPFFDAKLSLKMTYNLALLGINHTRTIALPSPSSNLITQHEYFTHDFFKDKSRCLAKKERKKKAIL